MTEFHARFCLHVVLWEPDKPLFAACMVAPSGFFHSENAKIPCVGGHPKNIIMLCCDAFGVLPPVAKLTKEQAM